MEAFSSSGKRPNIRLDGRCPICNTTYDYRRLKILAEREQHLLTYIDCGQCGGAILSILTVSPMGLTAMGLLTDLSSDEVLDSDSRWPVTSDEVLEFHSQLDQDESLPLDLKS